MAFSGCEFCWQCMIRTGLSFQGLDVKDAANVTLDCCSGTMWQNDSVFYTKKCRRANKIVQLTNIDQAYFPVKSLVIVFQGIPGYQGLMAPETALNCPPSPETPPLTAHLRSQHRFPFRQFYFLINQKILYSSAFR